MAYEYRDILTNTVEIIDSKTNKVIGTYSMEDIDRYREPQKEGKSIMKSFEERKQEYLNKLTMNKDIIMIMQEGTPAENLRVVLNPCDEKELAFAETLFTFMEDSCHIFIDADLDYEPNIEDNRIVNYCIDLINKVKNNEDIDIRIVDPEDSVAVAEVLYDTLLLTFFDGKDINMYVAKKCGLDLDNFIDEQLFTVYMKQAGQAAAKNSNRMNEIYSEMTDKEIEIFINCANEFHKLCESKKNIDSDDKSTGTK